MNGFEIFCMFCGCLAMFFIRPSEWKFINKTQLFLQIFHYTIIYLGSLAMILLPLYFNYWRK